MKGMCRLLKVTSGGSFLECTACQCTQCPKENNIGVITPKCFKVRLDEQPTES